MVIFHRFNGLVQGKTMGPMARLPRLTPRAAADNVALKDTTLGDGNAMAPSSLASVVRRREVECNSC